MQRSAAEKLLLEFQEHPQAWTRVDMILETSQNQATKYFALQVGRPLPTRAARRPLHRRRECLPHPGLAVGHHMAVGRRVYGHGAASHCRPCMVPRPQFPARQPSSNISPPACLP